MQIYPLIQSCALYHHQIHFSESKSCPSFTMLCVKQKMLQREEATQRYQTPVASDKGLNYPFLEKSI